MKKIIAFSGSNSSTSINQQLVHAVSSLITTCDVEVIDLRDYLAPMYGIDLENEKGIPDSMLKLKQKLKEADGYIVSSPEHNGAMPAFLKNAIDWLSRIEKKVFDDKPVLFLSTSPGARGGQSALENLLAIMPYRGAKVVSGYSLGNFHDQVIDGELQPEPREAIVKELDKLINQL